MYIHITYCTNEGTNEPTKHDIIYEDNDMITLRVYLFVRSSEKQINKSEAGQVLIIRMKTSNNRTENTKRAESIVLRLSPIHD